jgi:transcriptional regulator of met regulon
MFGIDQQVQQTADAYRGKPQMLQQKYAQNQQLIDLLALQKLKSDKEEASRQMALSMQGKPPTIADQRESQVLDMTKKEVIDQQSGIMQNKMQQQQAAQQKLMQAAGAPQMPAQAAPQPQLPPSAGLAGLSAPNIQGMAGGGIVAFAGPTGSRVEGDEGEAEARRYMEQQRQRQSAPQQTREAAPRGGMQAGLDALLAIRPEELFKQRSEQAAMDANYNAEERAGKQRIIDERSAAYDRNKFARALMGMAGYSSPALAIAGGGAAAANDADQAMRERQRGEGQLIDIGPAARMAGLKAGETAYGHAMPGLVSGVRSGVDLAQVGEQSANRMQLAKNALDAKIEMATSERERKELVNARDAADKNPLVVSMIKEITANNMGIDHPENAKRLTEIYAIQRQIYRSRGFDPDQFVPPPVAAVPVPPKQPGMFSSRPPLDKTNPLLVGK